MRGKIVNAISGVTAISGFLLMLGVAGAADLGLVGGSELFLELLAGLVIMLFGLVLGATKGDLLEYEL